MVRSGFYFGVLHDAQNLVFILKFFSFNKSPISFLTKDIIIGCKIHSRYFRGFIWIILSSLPILQKAISDFLL